MNDKQFYDSYSNKELLEELMYWSYQYNENGNTKFYDQVLELQKLVLKRMNTKKNKKTEE